MTLNDYRKQFTRNLMIMSRTANGRLDLSASATKKDSMAVRNSDDARTLALENADRALEFLYQNRRQYFRTAKDLEELVLQTAKITNRGIVKEDCLFRSGKDSDVFCYTRIKDIPAMWNWFINTFFWMLTTSCFDVEEIAAFSEYGINQLGHFFSDGCGKISMLVSTYLFMRFDKPCVEYTSRDDYYSVSSRSTIPTVSGMRYFLLDPELENFISYYTSLCPNRNKEFFGYFEKKDDSSYTCHLVGMLTGKKYRSFSTQIKDFYGRHSDVSVTFDCSTLAGIDLNGVSVFKDIKEEGKSFVLENLNADCKMLFKHKGFEEHFEGGASIRKIDLSSCKIISEGANGIIYRVSDEIAAKRFKNDPDYEEIARERLSMKNALISGIPAPISLGYAEYNGEIISLMELIHSKSLLEVISEEKDSEKFIIRYAQLIKKLHRIQDEKKLSMFHRKFFEADVLGKADKADSLLPEKYKGRARKIIEAVDEPECLVHGDIQPKNIMISGDDLLFIDFDSFSTGKGVYDLGALYRTLFDNAGEEDPEYNAFLHLPLIKCKGIWEVFVSTYYKDFPEKVRKKRIAEAKLIGTILGVAKSMKKEADLEVLHRMTDELEKSIDEYDCVS